MSTANVMRVARKITKAVLSREQMDGVGAKGKSKKLLVYYFFLINPLF
jgi:hypothetical protein